MPSSGEIHLLNKLADLANRCGISPTIANANIQLMAPEDSHEVYWSLSLFQGEERDEHEEVKADKFLALLGLEGPDGLSQRFENLRAIEKVVDHALSLSPSQRSRSR